MRPGSGTTEAMLLGPRGQRWVSAVLRKLDGINRDLTQGDEDELASWRGSGRGRRKQIIKFGFIMFTVSLVQPNSFNCLSRTT